MAKTTSKGKADSAAMEVRHWQGQAIQRRVGDGYVNATAMCKANGKRWHDYVRYDRSQEYVAALMAALRSAGIHADPIQAITTGPNHLRGTWIHPRLCIDLARWISPPFAVWMDSWFLEQIEATYVKPVPAKHQLSNPLPPPPPPSPIQVHAATALEAQRIWEAAVNRWVASALVHYSKAKPSRNVHPLAPFGPFDWINAPPPSAH